METDLLRRVACYYSGEKNMTDISVCQLLYFFKSIHIIVHGHKIKMPSLFQHRTLI